MVAVVRRPVVTEADLALAGAAIRRRQHVAETLPEGWRGWLAEIFSGYVDPPFATYHEEYWDWLWSIEADQPHRPFVAIWPRGFGKSTAVEVGCAMLAARQARRYVLYVCDTQYQADTHVQNVAGLIEASPFVARFPTAARRRVGKYGSSSGWRRNRLRTASGFTIDAIGLDTAARGAKVDKDRPDLIVFDDLDDVLDSPAEVKKKITLVTKSLLPARADHAAVLVAQNLVHEDGVVARLADGRADFLTDRIVSGPHPAITDLVTEQRDGKAVIVSGESTWPAKSLPMLQKELTDLGLTAFLAEKQHEVGNLEGGIFGHVQFRQCTKADVPALDDIQVWVDPAVTDTDKSDAHGIQADGIARDGTLYRLYSWEARSSPEDALRRAILKARELKASCVGIETNQGGDTWYSTYELTWRKLVEEGEIPAGEPMIALRQAKAGGSESKRWRATQMLAAYERGEIVHVISGTHETLERALRRYLLRKPFDLVDACLIAGTLVETDSGFVPIERIRIGDRVVTRVGYRTVNASGLTARDVDVLTVSFADGTSLTGTANHPIFTAEKGWIPLSETAALHGMIRVCPILSIQSESPITDGFTGAIRTPSSAHTGCITSRLGQVQERLKHFIGRCGSTTTDRFRRGMTFITAMMTRSTMIPATSSASHASTIVRSITKPPLPWVDPIDPCDTLIVSGQRQPNGTPVTRVASGIVSMASARGKGNRNANVSAKCAKPPSRLALLWARSTAQPSAGIAPSRHTPITSLTTPARNAGSSFGRPDSVPSECVLSRVETVSSAGRADVYNLSVAEQPEYFANGVLVHNCYWAWFGLTVGIDEPEVLVYDDPIEISRY